MKITTHSLLLALIGVAGLNLPLRGQPVQAPGPSGEMGLKGSDTIDEKMFPDGLTHDFGTVQRGTQLRHTFRVVNTSSVPLRIVSVRASMGPHRA